MTISQPYAMVTALIPKTMQNTAANVEMIVTMVRYASQENALSSAKTVTCFAMEYASKYSTMTNTVANVTKRAQQALSAKVEDVFVQPSNPSATAPALISRTMMNIAVNVMYVVAKGAYAMVAHASAMKESHTAKIHVSIQISISNTADNATKHAQANTLAKKAYADPHVRHLNSIAMGLVSTPH